MWKHVNKTGLQFYFAMTNEVRMFGQSYNHGIKNIYTYVTLVCGKSVVMRNCNNFSRLLWKHTFAEKTAAWPPLQCQPFPSSTPATQKEVRLSTMGDTRQKINQVGLTCSPWMLKTRKAQFLFFSPFALEAASFGRCLRSYGRVLKGLAMPLV